MRSKKALFNFLTSLLLEVITVISGFVIPRVLIHSYGSSAYGLTTSITQFLGYLTLLQSGVGGVVRAALYKPLADKDSYKLNCVIRSTESFFRKIAGIAVAYTVMLMLGFRFINDEFGFWYTAMMVAIIAIGTLFQYFFGITYQMLLQADQKSYIYSLLQSGCAIANIVLVSVSVNLGASIHVVKLVSSIVFALRPIIINLYVRNKYQIKRNSEKDMAVISQRWDGFGQTIAYFVHTKTDVFLITLILTYVDVAVYSVYALVASGLNTFITAISNAVQAAFGNMIAKKEKRVLDKNFGAFLTLVHMVATILFSTAIIMVIPFVKIYTVKFDDPAKYINPTLGILLLLAECMYCFRLPYHTIITSAGHYKQTRKGAYIEAAINIVLSLVLIFVMGIQGVAVATLIAMIYRTCDYVYYLSKNLLQIPLINFIKHMASNCLILILSIVTAIVLTNNIVLKGFVIWGVQSAIVVLIVCLLTIFVNILFFKDELKGIASLIKRLLSKEKKTA